MHQYICIPIILLEKQMAVQQPAIIYGKKKQQCNQFQHEKSLYRTKLACDNKGSRAKKPCCKKLAANLHYEKCTMCAVGPLK